MPASSLFAVFYIFSICTHAFDMYGNFCTNDIWTNIFWRLCNIIIRRSYLKKPCSLHLIGAIGRVLQKFSITSHTITFRSRQYICQSSYFQVQHSSSDTMKRDQNQIPELFYEKYSAEIFQQAIHLPLHRRFDLVSISRVRKYAICKKPGSSYDF